MAGANRLHHPRRGSLQFWPRKRAKRQLARIRNWVKTEQAKVPGFIGYKVGMTTIIMRDSSNPLTKGMEIAVPVTILECPPMKATSLVFYKKTPYGLKVVHHSGSKKTKEPQDFDELRLLVHSQVKLAGFSKKKPDILEIPINSLNNEEKLKLGKELLNKEIKIKDIFKEGQYLDVHAVTKGKGFQGTVKRFGVKIRQHKSEKTKRGVGNLGSWTPKRVEFSVAQPGKMGYHTRTEHNKILLKIGDNPGSIMPKEGFLRYGVVKTEYAILKGSVQGPKKRAIVITESARSYKKPIVPEIISINTDSKQT